MGRLTTLATDTLPPDHLPGANYPPEPVEDVAPAKADPIDALTIHANDLRIEVGNWADGTKIDNAAQAAVVEQLIEDVKAAIAAAEEAREGEIKPITAQVTALREKYYPLIGETKKITGSLIKMKTALLEVKTDWGNRENARIAKEAAEARAIAAKAAQEAADAARAAQGNIEAAEEAEALVHTAKAAAQDAKAIESETVKGMRANWVVKRFVPVTLESGKVISGEAALIRHYMDRTPDVMIDFVRGLAEAEVRCGTRSLPGIEIVNEPRAI